MRAVLVLLTLATMIAKDARAEDRVPDARAKQQAEALRFVKQCVLQVKRRERSVLKVVTDANILFDVEAELKKQGDKPIEWDKMFGKLSELTDCYIRIQIL